MRTLLVDDEYLALNLLEGYAQQLGEELTVVGKVKEPLRALELLRTSQPPVELLLLDVQMPRLSGPDLLRALPPGAARPAVVFTTAYEQYAVEAFGLDAVDYLTKPIAFPRFVQAVGKARQWLRGQTQLPADPAPAAAPPGFLTVRADGKYVRLALADILLVEGWQEYVRIHTLAHGTLVVFDRLKNLEAQLPAGPFLRVHKSYLVATNKIESLDGNELRLGPFRVPVSRELRERVLREVFGR